jgi:hypothetical protein
MEAVHGPQKKRAPWLAWSGGARAARMGCEIVKVYKDHGISGARGRDQRPAFNSMCRAEERVRAGLARAKAAGTRLGRPIPTASQGRRHTGCAESRNTKARGSVRCRSLDRAARQPVGCDAGLITIGVECASADQGHRRHLLTLRRTGCPRRHSRCFWPWPMSLP